MTSPYQTSLSPDQLADKHCHAESNLLSKRGYISARYGVSQQFFSAVSRGKKKPSRRLIDGISQVHLRLFPSDPVLLLIPNFPPILIGQIPAPNQKN